MCASSLNSNEIQFVFAQIFKFLMADECSLDCVCVCVSPNQTQIKKEEILQVATPPSPSPWHWMVCVSLIWDDCVQSA